MSDITAEERAKATVTEWFRKQWPSSSKTLDPHVDCDYKRLTKCIATALHAHAEAAYQAGRRDYHAETIPEIVTKTRAEERRRLARVPGEVCKRQSFHGHGSVCPVCQSIAAAIRARA